ncbi:MAG: hypothetical protein ABR587_08530 [Candidatus Binatia bacterium]
MIDTTDLRRRADLAARRAPRRMVTFVCTPVVAACACVALLSASTWHNGSTHIEDVSSTLMGIRQLVSGDSEHYLAIADSLREGDWRMRHVEPTGAADRAHRQPGYSALLALAGSLGIQGAPALARVNVAVVIVSLWIAFFGVRLATGSSLAGLLAAAVLYDARFLFDIATERLLTEPLYVAVAIGAVAACMTYARRPGAVSLLLAAALAGLAYDVRVNGLFLAVTLAVGMVFVDVLRARRADPDLAAADVTLHLPIAAYAAALALFAIVTTPSWLPRTIYTGNPLYHGYLSNYLWVDDYERAHVPGPPQFSFSIYAAEHSAADAARRMAWGMQRVFLETPRDKFGIVTTAALLAAVLVLLALRDTAGIVIACAAVCQALPLAWTALANPARRLPAAALLPFAAVVIAAAAAALLRHARRRTRAQGSASPTAAADPSSGPSREPSATDRT